VSTRYDSSRRNLARAAGLITALAGFGIALMSGLGALTVAGWLLWQGRWGFALAALAVGAIPVLVGVGMARAGWILVEEDERMSGEPPR
jgi:hypothetical protein